ncbi:zinc ribbon domain-containing protein [Streptomyces sp. INA 01156]
MRETSTMLARTCRLIRFEKLHITTMTRSAKGTLAQPGTRVRQKAGLNRAILAQGWACCAAGPGEGPRAGGGRARPYTSLRCSACGWIERDSRKSQAEFVCISCGFGCNADENAAINVAAGQGGIPAPAHSRCRRGDSGRLPFERP